MALPLNILAMIAALDDDDNLEQMAIQQEEEERRRAEARVRRRRRRRWWVRPWLLRRPQQGQYEQLMGELLEEDHPAFSNFIRLDPAMFRELMEKVGDRITKNDTWYRKALVPGLKISITLRFYATGDSYRSLMYGFRVSDSAISILIREVSEAIIAELSPEVLLCPTTPQEWKEVALQFKNRWQFQHCLGELDGKHIAIKCPNQGGSL